MSVFISLRDCDRVLFWNYNRLRVLHAVDSLNVKRELRSKKLKQFCIMPDADISKRYFLVFHLKIVFLNFLHELKQRSSAVTGRHYRQVDSDVTEGVITTRSNRMKFRLRCLGLGTVIV